MQFRLDRLLTIGLFSVLASMAASCSGSSGSSGGSIPTPPVNRAPAPVHHVFVIVLENKNESTTFGKSSSAPYLAKTLPSIGAFVPYYYGIGHHSADNYIALISGQPPDSDT